MNFAFLVRRIDTLVSTYTTTLLALEAHKRGHGSWLVRSRDLVVDARGRVFARAYRSRLARPASPTQYVSSLAPESAEATVLRMDALDVLFLRGNPHAAEAPGDGRYGTSVLSIAQMLRDRGVTVINDPVGLQRAGSKVYIMSFPEAVRPRTLVATDGGTIKRFLRTLEGPAVLKPIVGFGGESVFYVRRGEVANVNQYITALRRTGPIIAQEYLEGARRGDKRVLVLDGEPVMVDGVAAVYKRVHPRDDIRNNMHVGGRRGRTSLAPDEIETIRAIAPQLRADGIAFAGVDLVDGKVLEVNVWSPGGIHNINELYGTNVAGRILDVLERRVAPRARVVPLARHRAS